MVAQDFTQEVFEMVMRYTHRVVCVQTNEGLLDEEVAIDPRVLQWETRFLELLLERETHSDGVVWLVSSRDGERVHEVRPEEVGVFTCTCPCFVRELYHTRYGAVCKHVLLMEFVSRGTRWHCTSDGFAGMLTPESAEPLWLELHRPPRGESTSWELRVEQRRHVIPAWLASELRGWYVGTPTWLTIRQK